MKLKFIYGVILLLFLTPIELLSQDITVSQQFSPNNDGLNDQLVITANGSPFEYQIFSRHGELISEGDQLSTWDGTSKGRSAPVGLYIVVVTIPSEGGKKSYKYTVDLLR